jgi:transcriptional repressor NrdR
VELRVIKRDGRHEPFDRHKLLSSFNKACEKRPIGIDTIEKRVEEIIQTFEKERRREVPTKLIGLKVMEKLQSLDPVAYVRYASVYRQFQEIGDFLEEIQTLERRAAIISPAQPELFS